MSLVKNFIYIKRLKKTSNGSFKIFRLTNYFNLYTKYKKLLFRKKWNSGRGSTGSITVYSKGPRKKYLTSFLNYSYRSSSLSFIAGVNYNNSLSKMSSLIYNSSGQITYLISNNSDHFFTFFRFKKIDTTELQLLKNLFIIKPFLKIKSKKYLILQQSKQNLISCLELEPLSSIKYTRSEGSYSKLFKLDTRLGLSLIKLSSGLKKLFSIYSLCSEGSSGISFFKKRINSTKSSDFTKKGSKPVVRGVAMNPVDHPHGGRTKSIKYPRTPWGKTTKYK